MRKRIINKADIVSLIRLALYEIFLIIAAATLSYYPKKNIPFTECLKDAITLASRLYMGICGYWMFFYLVRNDWHFRWANNDWPVYVGLILVIINAVLGVAVDWNGGRGFATLLIPLFLWLWVIVKEVWDKWTS